MATVADLWGEPEVKPKGGASDIISPKQKSFSTYKNGIEINEPMVQQPQGVWLHRVFRNRTRRLRPFQ